MSKSEAHYEAQLRDLQIALVRTQMAAIADGVRLVVVIEGRDAAGKDGALRRILEPLAVRSTRSVSLPKPSDRQKTEWWFQRYVRHLPAAGEWVFFNRSWYNRAGVEPVMGFCTPREHQDFLRDAPAFEALLVGSGVILVKYWLDISRQEQAKRLADRRSDPLKALKLSPMDDEAQKRWSAYSAARDEMLQRTHSALAPWTIVHTDDKKLARLNLIRHLLRAVDRSAKTEAPDPDIVFDYQQTHLASGRLEP